jgi:hypothetical protein
LDPAERKSECDHLFPNVTHDKASAPWIPYILGAIEGMAIYTINKILAIRNLLTETLSFAKEHLPSRVCSKDLIELLFHQPYTKANFLVDAGISEKKLHQTI